MEPPSSDALQAESARAQAEAARRRREAEALVRSARFLTETLDMETVCRRIVDSVRGLFEVPSAGLRLREPDGSLVMVAASVEPGGPYMAVGHRAAPDFGVYRLVVQSGQPLRVPDLLNDPRVALRAEIAERVRETRQRSFLAVPLRVRERITGALSITAPLGRAFSDDEIALLQAFADHAALALENARLFAEGDRRRGEAEVLAERLRILHEIDRALIAEQDPVAIAEAVLWRLRDLLGVPRAIVNVFDFAAGEVEWLAAVGRSRMRRGPGVRYSLRLAGDIEALRRGEPQVIDVRSLPPGPEVDALLESGVHVYMVVPMIAGGELIGSVSFGGDRAEYPPEQIGIAQEVATQLAIAIAQARLHERVKRQAEELEVRVQERTRELEAANDVLGQEIAERRRAEAEADRANRAKSEFLSRMSHELRTPLNAILGFAQLLEMDALTAEQQDSVGYVLRAGRHLLGLIDEVLDVSGIEAGRLRMSLEPVPVRETVRQTIELVGPSAAAARVSVEAVSIDERLHVLADRQRLQQVVLNLLSNAIKYNRPDGTVAVRCEPGAGDRVRILVTDTGQGIAPDMLDRLFVAFDRLGAEGSGIEGTGLGLALSRSLVEAMGGTLAAESRPGEGSTFVVELTVAAEPAVPAPGRPEARARGAEAEDAGPPRTVLYIEDNLSNLRLVESVLGRRRGLTVVSAMQGRVGLDLARDHRPDLILLDRHLPDMPGDEVFRLLRDDPRTRAIPVVMLSADAMPATVRRLLDAGVQAYLTKPLDVHRLLAALDEAIRPA